MEEEVTLESITSTLGITKSLRDIEECDIIGKRLQSLNQWQLFYNCYSRIKGFGVRNDKVRRDKNNQLWQRRWVCSREGFRRKEWLELPRRKKTPKPVTRVGCKACIAVTLDRHTNEWVASSFITEHVHNLASAAEVQFIRSHRHVPESMLAQARSMRQAGIRTMSILDYIQMQCGGRDKLPFLKRDFYNKLATCKDAVGNETDSEGALGYLTCLAIRDGHFFCRFNVDEEHRLSTMFWSDGTSRRDYHIFGEVIAFDTTYRTNAYNKPLLLIVGVNHHFSTNVYGVALLTDETATTFTWVLRQFLECMDGRHPKAIVTDGDHAMRLAISEVFPMATHRLCAWHLEKNAASNVPDGEFKIHFSRLMYKFYTEEEFESDWRSLIDDHLLQGNEWTNLLYQKRHSWAETFLRGHFFGGMRTTQRCESINSYMRRFLENKHLLRDFVAQIDKSVQNIRYNELQDDYTSKHTDPVIPASDPLRIYYVQVASACTRNIYNLIAKNIMNQNSYTVYGSDFNDDCVVYRLARFRYGEIRHEVRHYPRENLFCCGCLLMETDGIPCSHIFTIMKHLSLSRIPDSLLRLCWRKDAKSSMNAPTASSQIPQEHLDITRLASLTSEFNILGQYASKYEDTFQEAKQQLKIMTEQFRNVFSMRDGENSTQQPVFDEHLASANNIVKDPAIAKTKGREREIKKPMDHAEKRPNEPQRRRCRNCNEIGHNRTTCTRKNNVDDSQNFSAFRNMSNTKNDTFSSQFACSSVDLEDDIAFNLNDNVQPMPPFHQNQDPQQAHSFFLGESSQMGSRKYNFYHDN